MELLKAVIDLISGNYINLLPRMDEVQTGPAQTELYLSVTFVLVSDQRRQRPNSLKLSMPVKTGMGGGGGEEEAAFKGFSAPCKSGSVAWPPWGYGNAFAKKSSSSGNYGNLAASSTAAQLLEPHLVQNSKAHRFVGLGHRGVKHHPRISKCEY